MLFNNTTYSLKNDRNTLETSQNQGFQYYNKMLNISVLSVFIELKDAVKLCGKFVRVN